MNNRIIYTLALLFAATQLFAQTYTYDNLNRLTKVVYPNGTTVTYTFDALGNRTTKKVTGSNAETFTITTNVTPEGSGTVTGGGTYAKGSSVELKAIANAGFEFKQWSDGETANPRSVTVSKDISYTATFQAQQEPGIDDAWYQKALQAIEYETKYYITTTWNNKKYYLTTNGYLTAAEASGGVFTFHPTEGNDLYRSPGWKLDECFSNPKLSNGATGDLNHQGHILTDRGNNRQSWEGQVWYLGENGLFAVRATNAISDQWGAATYWTALDSDGNSQPEADYSWEPDFRWQLGEWTEPTPSSDPTSKVGISAQDWHAGGLIEWAGPTVTTHDGRETALAEKYAEPATVTGTVLEQTVTGLENGAYKVELYANACFTSGRGFSSSVTDGQMNVVYLFANDTKLYIPVRICTSITKHGEYTLNTNVTNGTLHLGMTAAKTGTNWHSIQIKSLERIGDVIPDAVDDIDISEGTYQIFSPDGRPVKTMQKGVNLVRMSNGQVKKVLVE